MKQKKQSKSIAKELVEELAVEHCVTELQVREERIIFFRCEDCGYKKKIEMNKDWYYEN